MPYKYVNNIDEPKEAVAKITQTKEVEKKQDKILTEEESQIETTNKEQKEFLDEDDDIIEVNWD